MLTNSWKASVSVVAGSVKEGKTIHASQSTPVPELVYVDRLSELVYASWSSELVLVSESVQCSSDSRIQEATSVSVKMFSVIVTYAAVNFQSE
jgi:hypothetical protein